MKKKYLLLYVPAGGGHVSTAKGIAKYFQENYADSVDADVVDGFQWANWLLYTTVIDGYKKSQTTGQWVYEFIYRANKRWPIAKISQILMSRFLMKDMERIILQHKPTNIVILHFFLIRPMMKVLKKMNINIPITTIITDPFTIHRMRSLEKNMQYVVFSEKARDTIIGRDVPAPNVHLYPIVLKEEFSHPLPADKIIELKKKFDLRLDKKVLLLLWGGDWLPKWAATLEECIKTNIDAQILILCGRSKSLSRQVTKLQKKYPQAPIKAFHGFIDFVYDLINVSDIIVTKAWPATVMEILFMNKIPVINSYIREQEKWNVEYVVENKLGFYEPNVKKLVAVVNRMLSWEDDMSVHYENIKNMHLRNGTQEVAEFLIKNKG